MSLRELRSFAAVADFGSITRTAEKLHLSPPAIHKQLKVLESDFGVPLYERVGRRLQLTQAAEVVLPYLRDVLAQYDAAMSALSEWKGLQRGLVRVGAGPTISSYVLPSLLKKFRRAAPGVELFVETGDTMVLLEGLSRGALDLALVVSPDLLEGAGFSVEASWDFEIVLVTNLREAPRQCRIAELKRFPFILHKKGSRVENLIDRYLAAIGFEPRVIMRFDNAEAIKAMMRTGLGISMLPMWTVGGDLGRGEFILIRQRERPLLSKLALLSRKSSYVPKPVRSFIEMAREFECKNPRLTSR